MELRSGGLVPLFAMTRDDLIECKPVTFALLEIREREGLQHVLRDHIKVLGDDHGNGMLVLCDCVLPHVLECLI